MPALTKCLPPPRFPPPLPPYHKKGLVGVQGLLWPASCHCLYKWSTDFESQSLNVH